MRTPEWVPPFLLGLGCVVAAEMAFGLLLYAADGFIRAVTLVLTFELAALAVGVASRPSGEEVSRLWRWMVATGTLLIAGVAAFTWSVAGQLPDEVASRGITLTLFAVLPMYGFGLVFAGLRREVRGEDGRRRSGRMRSIGAPALAGATLGVPTLGFVLLPRVTPVSVYLFSLLCLSSAAQIERSRRARVEAEWEAVPSIEEFAPDP
ncbi:MAG: hypothetical protein RQ745_13560 [Longimicrobiales bacterium]|nr:hypothetical protein [Longimicrobiales bacterium]